MLPSCGHFRNIACPFYKLALCVRPHCPYKHQNTDNGHSQQVLPQLVDETESIFDSKLNLTSTCSSTVQQPITYIPTPVDSKPAGILKSSNSIIEKPSSVPVYKPTPISKLKESSNIVIKKSNKSGYEPEYPITIRKKKNVEEYDPTEVKCIPKKSVSFIDPSSSADCDVPVILISSEDEFDDSESAPKFSDDDIEEEPNQICGSKKQSLEVSKQIERTTSAKKDEIEIVEIDKFSVVDKILVDSKKNDLLLKAKQNSKLLFKGNESSKLTFVETQTKSKSAVLENVDIKLKKEPDTVKKKKNESIETKSKKSPVNSVASKEKGGKSNSDLKTKKNLDSASKCKKGEKTKKDDKIPSKNIKASGSKKEKGTSIKESRNNKSDKLESKEKPRTQSTLKKDKSFKESKDHSLKIKLPSKQFHECKKHPSSDKISKMDNLTNIQSSNKCSIKKRSNEERSTKLSSNIEKYGLKKNKNFENCLLSSEVVVSKTSKTANKHSPASKRKYESSNSGQEHQEAVNKSLSMKKKKMKTDLKILKSSKFTESSSDSIDDFVDSCDIESDLSFSDPDEECRRIFNECYPEPSTHEKQKEAVQEQNSSSSSDLLILRKKRFAHPGAVELKKRIGITPKVDMKRPTNPAQVMFNRFAQVQAKFSKSNGSQNVCDSVSKGSDKKKLNFVPNHSLLAAVKSKNEDNSPSRFSPFLPSGVTTTLKPSQRVAHIPEAALKPRPIIPADFGSKVPSNVRQKFLNAFIDECLKFMPAEDEAYDQAIEEEKKAYDRSSSKALYMNVAANTLKRLRNQAKENSKKNESTSSQNAPKRTVSHEAVLNGPIAQRRSFSIGPKKKAFDVKDLSRTELYEHLLEYVLTLEQLKENGFPQPHPVEKDRAVIEGVFANRTNYCNDAFKRVCCRCQKTYYVNVDGDYVRDEECDFHWGRIWKKKIAGTLESRYSCCQGDAESDGCCVSPGHVFEGSESHALKGFVKTPSGTRSDDTYYGIYALDCEMCYTTAGMELTRVTVIDSDLKPVYESFVKPQHKILDFNTRFSGIAEDDLKNVRTTLQDVQAVLLCIFSDRTILIGHSLESDFKALKIFHRTVVDTSVVFPHKNGLPFKRALRTLMAEKLNKIIQNDIGGHDSHEDAAACMELMLWKIKEDLKGNR